MNLEPLVQTALVLTLLAFSIHVAVRAGAFSVTGVACYGTGAYTAGALAIADVPAPLAVLAAVVQAALLGFVLALVLGRLRSLYLAMATFAFVLLVQVLALEWEPVTGGALGLLGIPVAVNTPVLLAVTAACTAGIALLERGRSGRMLEALRLDDQLAASLGIPVVRNRRAALVLSAALGGLAGALSALLFSVFTPDQISFELIVDALTMIVIGGTAAWYGPVVGAAVVASLPEVFAFAGDYRPALQAAIVVVLVIYAPDGAVGLVRAVTERVRRARHPVAPDKPVHQKVPS